MVASLLLPYFFSTFKMPKMKRHSLTAIVAKVQVLASKKVYYFHNDLGRTARFSHSITHVAVNEINRLQAEEEMDKLADRTKARLDMEEIACKPIIE